MRSRREPLAFVTLAGRFGLTWRIPLRIPDRRSAAGMVMREAKPVQRTPLAKLLGASKSL